MDFRFTIAINPGKLTSDRLTPEQVHELHEEGFEIANHGWSHGLAGLPLTCPKPPAGSLLGYTMCDGLDPFAAAISLQAEIERDSIATFGGLPCALCFLWTAIKLHPAWG